METGEAISMSMMDETNVLLEKLNVLIEKTNRIIITVNVVNVITLCVLLMVVLK
jgi:hypothetical protein